jgi:hypothetical protein
MFYKDFYVYTAMVCYNCRRDEVVRLKQSWRNIYRTGKEKEALDVVLVSCPTCLEYPYIHNPLKAVTAKYIDIGLYIDIIDAFSRRYNCTASILEEKRFSIMVWGFKSFTRVRDISDVVHPVTPPDAYITMFEKDDGYRFIRQDPILPTFKTIRYPSVDSTQNYWSIPPSSAINNLPEALLYPDYLEDAPPSYKTISGSER